MTTKLRGQCDVCIYRYQNIEGRKCEAFPDVIPDELFYDQVSHRIAYNGDNGIHFEQDPKQPILEG